MSAATVAGQQLVEALHEILDNLKEELSPERRDRMERALRRLGYLSLVTSTMTREALEEELDAVHSVLLDNKAIAALAIATAATRATGAAARILRAFVVAMVA